LNLGLGDGLRLLLEFLGEGLVIEEDIGIVELVVPCALEIAHGADQLVEFLVTDEGDEGGIGAGGLLAIWGVIVILGAP
jgi:hypothetical protein